MMSTQALDVNLKPGTSTASHLDRNEWTGRQESKIRIKDATSLVVCVCPSLRSVRPRGDGIVTVTAFHMPLTKPQPLVSSLMASINFIKIFTPARAMVRDRIAIHS